MQITEVSLKSYRRQYYRHLHKVISYSLEKRDSSIHYSIDECMHYCAKLNIIQMLKEGTAWAHLVNGDV